VHCECSLPARLPVQQPNGHLRPLRPLRLLRRTWSKAATRSSRAIAPLETKTRASAQARSRAVLVVGPAAPRATGAPAGRGADAHSPSIVRDTAETRNMARVSGALGGGSPAWRR
jgi:hypothetical protein